MTQRLVVRPEAESDVASAAKWYDEQRPGLSLEFRSALDHTLSMIQGNPEICARIHRYLRRALLQRFPYGVYYVDTPDSVIVVAVLHTSRSGRIWRARAKRES